MGSFVQLFLLRSYQLMARKFCKFYRMYVAQDILSRDIYRDLEDIMDDTIYAEDESVREVVIKVLTYDGVGTARGCRLALDRFRAVLRACGTEVVGNNKEVDEDDLETSLALSFPDFIDFYGGTH